MRIVSAASASALAIALALLPAVPAAAADDPATAGEQITSYDVQLAVQRDGSLTVQETIAYDFGGNARHGIERDIDTEQRYDGSHNRRFPVSDVTVSSPDAPDQVQVSGGGKMTSLRIGDPDQRAVRPGRARGAADLRRLPADVPVRLPGAGRDRRPGPGRRWRPAHRVRADPAGAADRGRGDRPVPADGVQADAGRHRPGPLPGRPARGRSRRPRAVRGGAGPGAAAGLGLPGRRGGRGRLRVHVQPDVVVDLRHGRHQRDQHLVLLVRGRQRLLRRLLRRRGWRRRGGSW